MQVQTPTPTVIGMSKTQPDPPTADFHDERLDLAWWYPKLVDIDAPTPETYALPVYESEKTNVPDWDSNVLDECLDKLDGEAFLRGGYKSAAHHIEEGSHIHDDAEGTIQELLFQHVMMKMPIGESLWLREWLDLDWCHYSMDQCVPEVRVFIRDGEVVCYHPRLDESIGHEQHLEEATEIIDSAWAEGDGKIATYAEAVADTFNGWWSVDFVLDTNGDWWCTDMALDALYDASDRGGDGWSGISAHPGDCEHDIETLHEERDS